MLFPRGALLLIAQVLFPLFSYILFHHLLFPLFHLFSSLQSCSPSSSPISFSYVPSLLFGFGSRLFMHFVFTFIFYFHPHVLLLFLYFFLIFLVFFIIFLFYFKNYFSLGIWKDEHIPGWKRVTDSIHAYGSLAGIQIAHAGNKIS